MLSLSLKKNKTNKKNPLGHKNIPVPLQQPVYKRQELLKNSTGKETNVGSLASK